MKRVTGFGGIFFKTKDPQAMRNWYKEHLGFNTHDYGATFEGQDHQKSDITWSPFPETTAYFDPSEKDFMLNFRVANLEELVAALKEEGVKLVGDMEVHDYGKFAWILDPEGNKIELWEPASEQKH